MLTESPILQVQRSQLVQDSIWLNVINIIMKKKKKKIVYPMNNQTYTTKNSVKQNISACGRRYIHFLSRCKKLPGNGVFPLRNVLP